MNSNPWFSAVSDYSLQIALYVHKKENILYCSEIGSTAMLDKCNENNIPFFHVPIHNQTLGNFIKSFFFIIKFLFINKNNLKYVWVFEGREHTLCSITKIIFPNLWKNKKLIRVRGQAQIVKSNFISKFIYNKVTDKVIFAANCVKQRVLFNLTNNNSMVHYYGKDILNNTNSHKEFYVQEIFPTINQNHLLFLVIGRFDPIKGHDYLVEAFLRAKFSDNIGNKLAAQLVFAGYKANINSKEMYLKYLKYFDEGKYTKNKFYLESLKQGKNLFIIEEKLDNIEDLLAITSFGVIPSLDSEVICRVGVEFLQCSIPVISSDVGALPEVFSDFNNLIFKAGDVYVLTKKLEESSQLFLNKEIYNSLRKKAKQVGVDKYSSQNYKKLIDFVDR